MTRRAVLRVWPPADPAAGNFSAAELAHEREVIARAPGGVLEAIPTWPHLGRLTLRTVGPRGPGGASSGGAGPVPLMPHHVVQAATEVVEIEE